MANISVVGRIVSDDIELKISANNRPYLRFDLAERTGKGAYARTQYYQVVAFGAIASQFAKRGLCRADQCGRHTGAGGLSETGWLDAG